MVGYVPRTGRVYVVALTTSFEQVLTASQARAIRGLKMKMRFVKGKAPAFFQIAFTSSPSTGATTSGNGIYTLAGSGSGDMAAPSTGIFARVRDNGNSGDLLEILTWG